MLFLYYTFCNLYRFYCTIISEVAFSREVKLAYIFINIVYVIRHIKYKLLYYCVVICQV
jgi:hypothetical protein